ncbi:hypothetical protein H5U35_05825, partial [Candidatus Aerophobetes bacterium]|nr:hypothetical protein [Candidatus Aerophobetes bacterium]
ELPSPSHRYSIYATFTRTVDAYVLHSDIVPESERVYVDGVLLTRDKDYIIDYTSGYLSFLNPDIIGSDTRIEVQYEWMPIMGGEATFLGARIEYRPNDNFSLGSTFLSQAAPEPSKIPDVGLAPQAQRVLEADVNFKLEPEISLPGGGRLPLKILFSGEYSRSTRDPNRFGAGMVEDFSAGKVEESLSLSEDSWMPGSRPDIASSSLRDEISISDEEIEGEKVNPIWSEDKITVLKLGFDLTLPEMWDSACYVISSTGKDFSQMRYLEVWTKGITGDIEVYFDVGMVSEDVDEDGILDTEDKNGDGILNPGEDTGILMNFPSGERTVGAGNGKLDTEDLDGDGKLDTEENFSRYLFSEDKKKELSTGWSKYEFLLDEPAGGQSWDDVKALVKHVRIWVKGDSFSGEIKFAKILISGDRWEKEGCEVKGVNNYDDPAFPSPFESQDFRNYYEKMFGSTTTSEGKWQKEEALSISTTSLEGGYIQQTFLSKRDFSPYRKICFWIYHDFEGGDFYLRFGSDVEANYYEYTLPLSSVSTGRWIKIEVPFTSPPLEVEGVPSFSEIKQIRIGVRDVEIDVPFFINDIYLTDVQREEGTAQRYYAKTDLSNFLSLSAEYRKVEPPFSVVGGSSTNTFQDYKKWSISSSYLKFMPFSYSRTEEYTHTEKTEGTSLEVVKKDKVLKKSQVYNVGLRFSEFPALSFKGSNTTSDYLSKEPLERGFEDVYDVSLKYPVPLKFPLLPADISASFKFKRSGKEIEETKTQDITRAGSISLPFRPLQNLVLKTSYSTSETVHDEDGDKTPKERTKNLSLDMQASFFKLTPKLQLEGGCKEDSFSSTDPDKRKVSTNFNLSLSLPFRPASFVRLPKTLSTLGWYFTYNLKKEGIYEDTGVLLERFDYQFGISRFSLPDGREKLWVEKTSFGVKQNLSPFPFLTTSLSYGWEEEERTELGTPYLILVKSWPAGQLKFNLNDTPLIKGISSKIFTSSDLVFEYSEKETQKKEISLSTSVQPSLSWRGMFKNPKNLTLTYSYESSTKRGRAWDAEVSSLEFSSTHQLKTGFSTSLLKGFGKIPLLRDLINFKSKVNVSCALTREYNYKKASSGLVEKNQEKWTLETALSSKLSENINTKLGLNFTYYKDKVKLEEDYFSWGGSVWVELVF